MNRKLLPIVFAFAVLAMTSACSPYKVEKIVEIEANETAFLVPYEETQVPTEQSKFMSVDFLNKAKLATKRFTIPQRLRSTGRMPWDAEWIDTVKVIKVNRSPVTREWTKDVTSGTSTKDQALKVESKDSIGFAAGISCTVAITEEDTALFLYRYAGKSLEEIADSNVRGYLQTQLSHEFTQYNLVECRSKKKEIFETISKSAKEYFKEFGITIMNFGNAEGLIYDNPQIQSAIDAAFAAEMDVEKAKHLKSAQIEWTKAEVEKARGQALAAKEFAKGGEAQLIKMRLDIEMIEAQAKLEAAKKYDGSVPDTMVNSDSNSLFGIGGMLAGTATKKK